MAYCNTPHPLQSKSALDHNLGYILVMFSESGKWNIHYAFVPWKCNPVISGCTNTPSCRVAVTGGHGNERGSAVVTCLHKW